MQKSVEAKLESAGDDENLKAEARNGANSISHTKGRKTRKGWSGLVKEIFKFKH